MESAGQMLEQVELDHMALAPQVITYELGFVFSLIIWKEINISRSSDQGIISIVQGHNLVVALWKNNLMI